MSTVVEIMPLKPWRAKSRAVCVLEGVVVEDADRNHVLMYLECFPKILDFRLKQWESHKELEHEMGLNRYICLKNCSHHCLGFA